MAADQRPRKIAPVPRPTMLENYAGMWVAVIDDEVVAAEHTSHALALQLHRMDHRKRRRAVVEYVRPTADSYIIGAGQLPSGRLHAFPWREEEFHITGGRILRPTVDVDVSSGDLGVTTKALIDTGAPRTLFPRGIGDLLGIEFPSFASDAEKNIQLMGRVWPAITRTVNLVLRPFDDMGWEAEVDFFLDEGLQFGILGYEGFLNRWAVSINGYAGYLIIEPADEFEERQPPEVLADLRSRWPHLFPP